jgi:hypothetical protein
MAIEIKINSMFDSRTKTAQRLYELITENTGTHFLDSGMSNGRHWQQNQGHELDEWLARPSAILETEYSTYATLDLFGWLNNRLELTEKAQQFQDAFEVWLKEDSERSAYSCADMEEWANQFHDSKDFESKVANSYNWENLLSQTIQFIDFEFLGETFTLLQVHGGADVRGGYTRPQVFETKSQYWAYDMTDVSIECTAQDCDFYISVHGPDVTNYNSCCFEGELRDLKVCPECNGTLEAFAPEPYLF